MLEVLFQSIDEDEIFIIELSSYQLDDIRYSPEIAVITNLFAEHLDYHHGVENYHLAKKNIIKYQNKQDFFIFNGENESLQKWISDTIVKKEDFTNIDLS
ncbi:MAG: hypothetical protein LBU14_04570 [Candidatus Peribacteria bacterium]|jgi:UDP-N-acetylmuramoylalanine--D-glutamate ligase|nr:hypothetical protein [Candidatus Peribacteria bacterium]